MNLSGMIQSFGALKYRIQANLRRQIVAAGIGLCGMLFIIVAAGFGLAAGYMWLTTEMPDHEAALVVAGASFFVGCVVIAVAKTRNNPHQDSTKVSAAPDIARQVDDATNRAVHAAITQVKDSPVSTVLTAVALGTVVGLLRPSDDT